MAASTVTVRAHQAFAGLKAGQIADVELDDNIKAGIEAGRLEKITKAEAKHQHAEHGG